MIFTIVSMILVILRILGIEITDWAIYFTMAIAIAECMGMVREIKKKDKQLKKAVEFADKFKDDADNYRKLAGQAINALEEMEREMRDVG